MIKKAFIIIGFIIVTAFGTSDSEVYICDPKGAKKYHCSNYCRGLSSCKYQIKKVPKSKAVSFVLTLCGWED